MFGDLSKTDMTSQDQDSEVLLQKKLSEDSVTSTKFFESTEALPDGTFYSTSSNSNKLLKDLKNREISEIDRTTTSSYNNKRTVLDSNFEKTESDHIETSENEKKLQTNSNDSDSSNSEKLEVIDNKLGANIFIEKQINSENILRESKTTSSIPYTSNTIENTHTYTKIAKDNSTPILNLSNNPINDFTFTSSYNGTSSINNNNSYSYSTKPYALNTYTDVSYPKNSYPSSNNNFSSYPITRENNSINNTVNPFSAIPTNSYNSNNLNINIDSIYNPTQSPYNSAPLNHISEYVLPPINTFEDSINKNNFDNNTFDINYNMSQNNTMSFLNMYSNNNTPLGSNNVSVSKCSVSPRGNVYTSNICDYPNENSNPLNMNGNVIYNNNGNIDSYVSNVGRSVNGKIEATVNHINGGNIHITESITKKQETLLPQIISNTEKISTGVEISEKINSHTDYARATHSSHVVDKKIVHEGYDTIKIPKYREVEIVEKIVEVPVVHTVNKYVNKYEIKEVEKIVKKPIKKYIETKIEVPELHYQDKIVEVPEVHEVVKIVKKPETKERIVYKNKIETKIIPKYIEVPVVKIVDRYEEYDDIQEVIKTVPIKKVIEIPNEVIKKVKVPIKKIIEQPNYVPVVQYRDIPVEKIRYVPKVQTVEVVKQIPKVIDVHVPYKVPKIHYIDKPYYVNKYVDKPVQVPVAKRITPIYKCEGKKIVEIPIHKPYIVTHDTIVPKNISSGIRNGQQSVYTKSVDMNSLSSIKQQELYNMVNKNNLSLQRSISVDNFIGKTNLNERNVTTKMNHRSSVNFGNGNTPQMYTNIKNDSYQSVGNYYNGVNNGMYKSNNLKITRSLNTPQNVNSPSFNSFSNINNYFGSTPDKTNQYNSNNSNRSFNFRTNNTMNNSNSNIISSSLSNPMTFNKQRTGSFPDIQEDTYQINNNNQSSRSRNYSSMSNFMNESNTTNSFMRSRSPSICSEGISAYVVEHVNGSQVFGDSNLTSASRYNADGSAMDSNYSFNGSCSNSVTKNHRKTSFM